MPNPNFIPAATMEAQITVGTEPALNGFTSLMALYGSKYRSGFSEWVTQTADALTAEQAHTHDLVMAGLHFAIAPERSFASFPDYLQDLEETAPEVMRDRLLDTYIQKTDDGPPPDRQGLLDNLGTFLAHLEANFSHVDIPIEAEAHRLLNDLPTMKATAIAHLRMMWDTYLAEEWQRVEPLVAASVEAFPDVNLGGMTKLEAFQYVTGEVANDHWRMVLEREGPVVFVPSAHIGPYKQKLFAADTTYIFFGARVPEGVTATTPDLTISEIMPGLNALSDGVRLRILSLIAEYGEMCTADVMEALDLTQSSAQRHLKQLSATGYLTVWRQDGAKCFSVNAERIEETFRAVRQLIR
jgi:ArsR family transcriptional regulator